jgi:hypothetical protein
LDVSREPGRCFITNRDDALFITLASARKVARLEIQIARAQLHELGDAQARCVEDLDQRAIAETARRLDVGLPDQAFDFVYGEKLRQRRPRARRLQIVGWIHVEMLRQDGEPEEPPDGGNGPGH